VGVWFTLSTAETYNIKEGARLKDGTLQRSLPPCGDVILKPLGAAITAPLCVAMAP